MWRTHKVGTRSALCAAALPFLWSSDTANCQRLQCSSKWHDTLQKVTDPVTKWVAGKMMAGKMSASKMLALLTSQIMLHMFIHL